MDARDSKRMIQLAREGKAISRIWEEDFPKYNYWDIYWEVNLAGEPSAVGTKRKITNRLKKLKTNDPGQQEIVEEINALVWHLYNRYKESQQKLDDIRRIIDK
ncbi:hypothetical protein [Desulfitobacterium hafniense]|uniref:hypothetical protein n=1 Tax=Desulfitobacterium hafniense TaxID=49338 RepID=UPI000367E19C|nr:hypothetical protein [Desulfitobacterium hafniense]